MDLASKKYAELLDRLCAELQLLGFQCSDSMAELPDEVAWIQVGVQKSWSAYAGEVKFAVNISCVSKSEWNIVHPKWNLPSRPDPNVEYITVGWRSRLSESTPRGDRWWSTYADTSIEPIVHEIVRLLKNQGLPELLRRRDLLTPPAWS